MRPETQGFQKPLSQPKPESVSLAAIQTEDGLIQCSCGWAFFHNRRKIREDAASRHLDKKHQGRGIWL